MARKRKDGRHNGLIKTYQATGKVLDIVLKAAYTHAPAVEIGPEFLVKCREQVTPSELLEMLQMDYSSTYGQYLYANRLCSRRFPNAREFVLARLEEGEVVEVLERKTSITRNYVTTLKTKMELGLLGIFVVD